MPKFYEPDLNANFDSPFVRDANNKLVRRSYWLDMDDKTLVIVMTRGIGANLTNDESGPIWLIYGANVLLIRSAFRRFYRPINSHRSDHRPARELPPPALPRYTHSHSDWLSF
jgi:hypothetical protein